MKRGGLLKRVSSTAAHRGDPRSRLLGGIAATNQERLLLGGHTSSEKYKTVNLPLPKKDGAKNRKTEKGGGSLFKRMVTRNKKSLELPSTSRSKPRASAVPPKKTQRPVYSPTPVTITSDDIGVEMGIEVPLAIPRERVPSYAGTEQTHEISQFSGQIEEEQNREPAPTPREKQNVNKLKPLKRSASARSPTAHKMVDTSAIPLTMSRSAKLARSTGNESVGDAQPKQPRRGFLPPLLQHDGDESASESTCSGITMDFSYGENMKTPLRQPVGRLGEGVAQRQRHHPAQHSFVPPSYITMDDDEDMEDSNSFGDYY